MSLDCAAPASDEAIVSAKILVIDDEPLCIDVVRLYLKDAGFMRVYECTDSEVVADVVLEVEPDLILLDVVLGDHSGIDILRSLRTANATARIPVIMMTAATDPKIKQNALILGASDFLSKPLDPKDLLPRVRNCIASTVLQERMRSYVRLLESEVHRREAVEHELDEARLAAVRANQAKTEFLARMSHEIRTPMTAILGFADMLMADTSLNELSSESTEWVTTIRRNGEYLLALINDILDLSKIEAGQLQVERLACSPKLIVDEVVELLRPKATAKGIDLKSLTCGDVPEAIISDPHRLRQVLINLVGNAVKFTEHGEVVITLRAVGSPHGQQQLTFDVTDTGIGIDSEQLENVFQAFQQADLSTTRRYGGSGLGLTISRRLAEALDGSISVESRMGVGSCFQLRVRAEKTHDADVEPANYEKAGTRTSHAASEVPHDAALSGLRVLLAEDGPDNRRLVTCLLEKAGAEVTMAEDGQKAVELVLGERKSSPVSCEFDVILMDMEMPRLDGYSATRLLRKAGYQRPIIALTANAMQGDEVKCKEAGCDIYITKPITREVTDVLTSAGYVVDQLPDGTGVQAQIRAAPPDLILLDILMPGIPGTEILVQLKKNPQSASIPVIMITAKSDEAELARCLESGATDFIGKPFGAVALLARIESALKAGDSLLELEHANTKLQYEIEARWRAEQELDRSKRRYGVAVEAGRIGLWEWDIKRDTVYLASYLQHMLLLEPNDLPRSFKDWLCRVHEADRHSLEVQFRQLSEGYVEGVELEHRLQRNDGSVMWVLTRARLERDKAGLPSTVNGVHADITERKAITDSLADSEAWNRSVLEAAADAILGVDDQGIIRSFNRTAEELFGYQSDEIVGQPVHLLLPENRRDWHVERFASFITGDFGVDLIGRRREVVAQRKNGAPVRVTLTVTEAKTEDSRLFTAVVQDLTKWDLREEELRQATAAADKANRAKSDFLANMSHEIRTPLNAILGFAQVLHAEVQDADIRHKLDAILSSGYHLLQLINDILDLSKIEAGKMQITLEDTSPTDIACGVIECLRGQARSKSLKLTDIWPDEIPITVNTDRARVAQLLFNLIGNALKFTEEGEVQLFNRFEVRNERCLWRMVVRDTGIGIPKDKLASIFSPFEQADSSVARTHGGTGLGLTICNWITQNLGGDLAVDSQ
ncbi:Hybrid signal transduction histidine kinase J, partial [Durusdinium trenchii]